MTDPAPAPAPDAPAPRFAWLARVRPSVIKMILITIVAILALLFWRGGSISGWGVDIVAPAGADAAALTERIVSVEGDVEGLGSDLEALAGDVRTVRDNQLVICTAVGADCKR